MTLQQSVPTTSELQATFCATLFDEWIATGLRDVVICPGSRSTPLALAASARKELTLHVRIDERSAGFFAIGRALATKQPVAIIVTSGTAAAELHACVAEADQAFVPLLVLTADRPPELHGVGAPQTINQHKLFGDMVRDFIEPGVASEEKVSSWRATAHAAITSSRGVNSGPVHMNLAFVEPLVADPLELPPHTTIDEVATTPSKSESISQQKVLCVVGAGGAEFVPQLKQQGWVVISDVTMQDTLSYFDPLLRSQQFVEKAKPDLVLRVGGIPSSKVLAEVLRNWNVPVWSVGMRFVADPDRLVSKHLGACPIAEKSSDAAYLQLWSEASNRVGDWLRISETPSALLSEPLVARRVVHHANENNVALVVGSSMPVRDVEWWSEPRRVPTFSNRGVNGIDGVVSTVLGVASASKAIGYIGDVTMLHDVSGLVDGTGDNETSCVLVISDNRGGGIFNFLTQAQTLGNEQFEKLFGTPRSHDLAKIAQAFGHHGSDARSLGELDAAVTAGLQRKGLSVVVAHVPDRTVNVLAHEQWNKEVADLIEDLVC